MPPKIAVITGPTATGKTRLGVLLAQRLGGEVVSADSMQLYRGMDIGTAKPAPEEMQGVPHHLIDVAEPWENWSAARYVEAAGAACRDILARGRLPIVVGGTGLYIDSLVRGLGFAAVDETGAEIDELCRRYIDRGIPVLIWISIDLRPTVNGPWYRTEPERQSFMWISNEHCVVLSGYDREHYICCDPWEDRGVVRYPRETVWQRHRELGMQAVAVEGPV